MVRYHHHRLPPEILELVAVHLDDASSLSACSVSSSFLRAACQKKLFESITLHLMTENEARNDELERILVLNPVITSYIRTLTLIIGPHKKTHPVILLLPHVRQLSLKTIVVPLDEVLSAIQTIVCHPNLSCVVFLDYKINLFPSSILRCCSGVRTLLVHMTHTFMGDLTLKVVPGTPIEELHCSNARLCRQVLQTLGLSLQRLQKLCIEHISHFLPMTDIQNMIDGASKSLRYLCIAISGWGGDEGFVGLSLAKLSNLTDITFVVFPRALPTLTIIGNAIESLPTSNVLRQVFLISESWSWGDGDRSLYDDDDAVLGEWGRLDHLLTRYQHAETLQAFYFVVPDLQDQFGRAWVASMSTRLPSLTAAEKVVAVGKSDCMSLRFNGLKIPDTVHT